MTPNELLVQTANLLEKGWCQGAFAKDALGNAVGFRNERATSYCAHGAFLKLKRGQPDYVCKSADKLLRREFEDKPVSTVLWCWNDVSWQTQANVVATFRRAAAAGIQQETPT